MTSPKISAYFYPTTVIIVDDNKRFLSTACFDLDENIAYRLFDNPKKALNYLTQEYKFEPFVNQILSPNIESNTHLKNQHAVSLNISAIHQAIYNACRYNETAVIIVDYNMPHMNGLEFCEKIKHLPFKKILITAAADERMAVKAFNEGIINKFILKNDPDFAVTINKCITELQHSYFQHLSESIINSLLVDPSCVLKKPLFPEFFNEFCQQHKIVEFYLYDPCGSYLLLDHFGNSSWLVVKTNADLEDYYDFARDSKAPASVLERLHTKKVIPFFPHEHDLEKVEGEAWDQYLYSATPLKSIENFCYAHVQNKPEFLLNHQKITSYSNYLNRLWPNFISKK